MAKRRMFSLDVVDSDAFMELPLSAQALYFHLGMRADDDGFVSNARRIQKLISAQDDDMKLLLFKRFVLACSGGIFVIKHWRLHNYVKNDRYKPTLYQEQKAALFTKKNGVYTDHPIPADELPAPSSGCLPPGNATEPDVFQNGSILEPQVRVGKGRLELGEDRLELELGKVIYLSGGDSGAAQQSADETVLGYLQDRGIDPSVYFGMTDEAYEAVTLCAKSTFAQFATRQPTKYDIMQVFLSCFESTETSPGMWRISFPPERMKLLLYAFEQAANAGKPGNWNYINGVLAKLYKRGICTIEQAEDYDDQK